MKKVKNLKKAIALVLFCAILTVSVLSIGVSATTWGPYYTSKYYSSNVMLYKYKTAIDTSTTINRTIDGYNYISKISVGSTYLKTIRTYACLYSGIETSSIFSEDLFDEIATNTTINKGEIVVGVSANYYVGGTAISTKTKTETSTNKAYVEASIATSEALTSYGSIEYRYDNNSAIYEYLTTTNY